MRINSRGKRRCPNFKSGHAGLMSEGDRDRFIRNEYLSGCEYTEYFLMKNMTLNAFLGIISPVHMPRMRGRRGMDISEIHLLIFFIAMKRAERSLYHIKRPVIWVTLIPKGRYVNENIIT